MHGVARALLPIVKVRAFLVQGEGFMTGIGKLVRGAAVACACVLVAACNQDASSVAPTATDGTALAPASGSATGAGQSVGPQAPIALVECEKEVPPGQSRSKISVNGNNLAPGRYRARVTSPPGSNAVVSGAQQTIGDEVEFDFDSKVDPGETFIPANYIQIVPGGPDVRGEILNRAGNVVAVQAVNCQVK
jgi:hypothetical protein